MVSLLISILFRILYFLSDASRAVYLRKRRESVKRDHGLKGDESMLNQHRPSSDLRSMCVERHNFDSEGLSCMQTVQILNCVKREGFVVITSTGEKGVN